MLGGAFAVGGDLVVFGRSQGLFEAVNAEHGELLWQVQAGREPSGLLSHFKRVMEPTSRRWGTTTPRSPTLGAGLWPSWPMAQEALDHPVHCVGGPR